ncbi:MAG: hypothetical protein J1E39_04700, partial [Eubacterium sp.]|nr:hypothetical protein [Eubacterium sp.]
PVPEGFLPSLSVSFQINAPKIGISIAGSTEINTYPLRKYRLAIIKIFSKRVLKKFLIYATII